MRIQNIYRVLAGLAIGVLPNMLNAQTNIQASDMLALNQNYSWGTARSLGLGGAFGALGGDMASLSLNPAGIGVYRTSDVSLSIAVNNNTANSEYYGHKASDFSEKYKIGNLGFVFTNNTLKDEGWISSSFGISYNQLNNFDRNIVIKNPNATSSQLDEFVAYANNFGSGPTDPSNLYAYAEGVAYEYQALDNSLFSDGWYYSDFTLNGNSYGQYQERRRSITGGIGEWNFSAGANYSHQLYIGASIGIQNLSYNETSRHTEIDDKNNIPNLQAFTYTQYFSIKGTGYNFKLGAIYKPVDFLRLGLALHSPTKFHITSTYNAAIETYFDENSNGDPTYFGGSASDRNESSNLSGAWKTVLSAALISPSIGLLSFDYERKDYSRMRMSDLSYGSTNDTVSSLYTTANNFRLGAEVKLQALTLRGGVGVYGTPYTNRKLTGTAYSGSSLSGINYISYSLGLGYRVENYYIDLGYMLLAYKDYYQLYGYTESNPSTGVYVYNSAPQVAKIDYTMSRFLITVGCKF